MPVHPLKATACFSIHPQGVPSCTAGGGDAARHPLKATACFGFVLLEEAMQQSCIPSRPRPVSAYPFGVI